MKIRDKAFIAVMVMATTMTITITHRPTEPNADGIEFAVNVIAGALTMGVGHLYPKQNTPVKPEIDR